MSRNEIFTGGHDGDRPASGRGLGGKPPHFTLLRLQRGGVPDTVSGARRVPESAF